MFSASQLLVQFKSYTLLYLICLVWFSGVSHISRNCTHCLFKFLALTMTNDTSLLSYVPDPQIYGIHVTFIVQCTVVPFFTHDCYAYSNSYYIVTFSTKKEPVFSEIRIFGVRSHRIMVWTRIMSICNFRSQRIRFRIIQNCLKRCHFVIAF